MKRKRFTNEQIIRILKQAEREDKTVAQVCRAHEVSENSYYRCENQRFSWRRKFGGMTVSELRRVRELEQENARLKRMMAERDLEIDAMKEVLSKTGERSAAPAGGGWAQGRSSVGAALMCAGAHRPLQLSVRAAPPR